ncbi:MAG: hypothetical protein WBV39_09035 [Rudaea sp.]
MSSDPLELLALDALERAAAFPRTPTPAEQFDRALQLTATPSQRAALLNEILLRAEAFGQPKPDLQPRRPRIMLL